MSVSVAEPKKIDRRTLGGWAMVMADLALSSHGLLTMIKKDVDPLYDQDPKYAHLSVDEKLGLQRKAGRGRLMTGVSWGIGGAIVAKWGHQEVPKQLERLENKLAAFMKEQGIPLDAEELQRADKHQQRSWFQKFEEFMYDFPMEIMNAYYAVAALFSFNSARLEGNKSDMAAMVLVMVGGLVSIFGKEKSKRKLDEMPDRTLLDKGRKLFHTKPLAFASGLYMINNVMGFSGAYKDHMRAKEFAPNDKRYLLKYAVPSGYTFSNILLGSGSKKAGGTDEEHQAAQEALAAAAGRILSGLSETQQEYMAQKTAEYLCEQKELRFEDQSPEEIAEQIKAAIPAREIAQDKTQSDFRKRLANEALSERGFSRN